MVELIKAVRGMNDIIPEQTPIWQFIEQIFRKLVASYGYQEVRFPILEKTALFKRGVGEITDIVEKEMFSFTDKGGECLSLRPEGTASCVRLAIQQGLLHHQTPRLWYMGPMFRHERPQKGRYRQFHQCSVEAFGIACPSIEAEIILMTANLWRSLGLDQHLSLKLNSLGCPEVRKRYREALVDYFTPYQDQLDDDSKRRLKTNPLRILDSKNPSLATLIDNAPKIIDYLSESSRQHFGELKKLLDHTGVRYEIQPSLVRGLDYYTDTVFEWISKDLGAQATVCAGGRYDQLVEQLGGKKTAAVGFSMGIERLLLLLETLDLLPKPKPLVDVYVIVGKESAKEQALFWAEQWRCEVQGLRIMCHCGEGSFKSQFKRADKSGALIAIIMAEDELADDRASIKYLRKDGNNFPQRSVPLVEVGELLKREFA